MLISTLQALSPLDGRYEMTCAPLRDYFSEAALMHYRLRVECLWLEALSECEKIPELPPLSQEVKTEMSRLVNEFDDDSAEAIKFIERTTNHDIKAVEYYLKSALKKKGLSDRHAEFIHFGCTSEDINNIAYALMVKDAYEATIIPALDDTLNAIKSLGKETISAVMMSHTHGQPATPTTMGKELANSAYRFEQQINTLKALPLTAKVNGAVGNFNAHTITYPEIDWPQFAIDFVSQLGLKHHPFTTQIEPHDTLAEHAHCLIRIHNIMIDFCRDIWQYISMGYFKLALTSGEIGSSTMPHKVNPIDFENAEGNFGLASAIFHHIAEKCPVSRLQRDLSDSTVLRNIGVAFGHSFIAQKALTKGLAKLTINEQRCKNDLNQNWEVLTEAIQTIMRKCGLPEPYEQCRKLTRGHTLTHEDLQTFITELDLPEDARSTLMALTPSLYSGLAEKLCRDYYFDQD